MAMNASDMANHIISAMGNNIDDPGEANSSFYSALCDYIEDKAEVIYMWTAVDPTGSPDPTQKVTCKIKTSGSLSPSGATDCGSALAAFAGALNSNASTWLCEWPAGFAISPTLIIPSIVFTASKATERGPAITHICQEIINGLIAATLNPGGTHGSYTGTATFIKIQ